MPADQQAFFIIKLVLTGYDSHKSSATLSVLAVIMAKSLISLALEHADLISPRNLKNIALQRQVSAPAYERYWQPIYLVADKALTIYFNYCRQS